MRKKAYFIIFYSLIVIIGGIIGFVKTKSLISILSAIGISYILDVCALFMIKGKEIALKVCQGVLLLVLFFFDYRFFLTSKIMPAGVMVLLTTATLSYMFLGTNQSEKH